MRNRDRGEKFIVSDNGFGKENVYRNQGELLEEIREREFTQPSFHVGRTEDDNGKKHNHDTSSFDPNESIEYAHGISFLNQIIPEILERFAKEGIKRKVKILDLGGGIGSFTDQIRTKFGDQVKVYSTSAFAVSDKIREQLQERKRTANQDGTLNLHKLDAYKSSIVDFRDFPEFDLIIDTYGEMFYALPETEREQEVDFSEKLMMIIKKLEKGGRFYLGKLRKENLTLLWWNLAQNPEYQNIKVTFGGLTKEEWIE